MDAHAMHTYTRVYLCERARNIGIFSEMLHQKNVASPSKPHNYGISDATFEAKLMQHSQKQAQHSRLECCITPKKEAGNA